MVRQSVCFCVDVAGNWQMVAGKVHERESATVGALQELFEETDLRTSSKVSISNSWSLLADVPVSACFQSTFECSAHAMVYNIRDQK